MMLQTTDTSEVDIVPNVSRSHHVHQLTFTSAGEQEDGGIITANKPFKSHHLMFLRTPGDISRCFCDDQKQS